MSNLEIQIIVILLGLMLTKVIGLQIWIVAKLFKLEKTIAILTALCPRCPDRANGDTDQIVKICKH